MTSSLRLGVAALLVTTIVILGTARAQALPSLAAGPDQVVVDREDRSVTLEAVVQRDAFLASTPPDHRYHALVNSSGSAAAKALFVTEADDAEVARALRELGAVDGGGVPLRAWTWRSVPLVPHPRARVSGSRVTVRVTWEGAGRSYELDELVQDTGGRGVEMRFGGNEEHDEHWDSGCILCLFSCPGGVMSNARYSIRDHVRGATDFEVRNLLPSDGTPIVVTLQLDPG